MIKLKISSKILISFVIVAVITLGLVGLFSYNTGVNTLEQEAFNKLTAVREMKASQIEEYFEFISDQVETFSQDRMIIDAMYAFEETYEKIANDLKLSDEALQEWETNLIAYYLEEFVPRLKPNLEIGRIVLLDDYYPQEIKTIILQSLYLGNNPNQTGSKEQLDNPGDGSSYSATHEIYHPIIKDYLHAFGYYDIFLVDVSSGGHIVYSVFKEVDFGTSLLNGPYADTNFGRVYRAALEAEEEDFVMLVDYEPYYPSYNAPAAFIASPIFGGEEMIGVLIFQMPIDRINNIMTNNMEWKAVGLGESGETYIVGEDFLLRNQSRFLIEDSENYFRTINEIGTPKPVIDRIRNLNSTIGLQEVRTSGTISALEGQTGTDIFPNYRGVPVFSSYKPLDIDGVNWVIMSEKDEAEVFQPIQELINSLLLGMLGLFAAIVLMGILLSKTITKPIYSLKESAQELSRGNLENEVVCSSQDEIGDLANSFEVMRQELRRSMNDLNEINQNLEALVQERTQELEQATERIRTIVEIAPDAVITIDSEQTITMFNPKAEEIFGYAADEVIGKPLTMLMPEESRRIHPSEVQRFYEEENSSRDMDSRREIIGLRKNGSVFPGEAGISKMVINDEVYFTTFFRDITERKELEAQIIKKTEELALSEKKSTSIIKSAGEGIIVVDHNSKVILWNQAAERMFGYTGEEILGEKLTKIIPEQYLSLHHSAIEAATEKGQLAHPGETHELSGIKKDGEEFPLELTVSQWEVEGEIYYSGILKDITERKEAEAQILQQKELLETTIESLTHPFYVIDVQDYSILLANSAAKELGISGQSKCYILTHRRDTPCDSLEDPCPLLVVKRTKEPFTVEHIHFDKDRNPRYVEVHGYPIFDLNGDVIQMIEYSLDITERKEAEKQLRLLSEALKSAADGVAIIDLEDNVRWVNPAFSEITGYDEDEIVGNDINILNSGKHPVEFYEQIGKTILSGEVWRGEITQKRKDGSLYPESLSLTPVYNKADEIDHFVSIRQDITERKAMERQLELANERMSEELNFAQEIQMSMLPLIFPAFPTRAEFNIYAHLIPAREVGGDFYDFYFLDEDHLCFVIGDVSGKGAPGALLMAVSKTLIKSRAMDDFQPSSILTHVNNELSQNNDSSMFVTVFLGVLEINSGRLIYCNAGHNPPYILRSSGEIEKLDDFHGPVIGALTNLTYKESSLTLQPNDFITLHTDGVTEAMNQDEIPYSDKRYEKFLQTDGLNTPQKLIDQVIRDVKLYENGAGQADDITMVSLQYHGSSEVQETGHLELKVKNQIEELTRVEEQFEEFCNQNQIPDPARQKVSIVLDELLNNVVNYAFRDEEEHIIEVNFVLTGNRLVITIYDDGVPFNPFELNPPNISLSLDERAIGGLGIFLVRQMMDEYLYTRHIGKNVIRLVKLIDND